jgi:uncharacterized membrane protein
MEGFVTDWLSLTIRWLHVGVAIAWIGESFHFVALDNSLRPPKDAALRSRGVSGEFWHMHGAPCPAHLSAGGSVEGYAAGECDEYDRGRSG